MNRVGFSRRHALYALGAAALAGAAGSLVLFARRSGDRHRKRTKDKRKTPSREAEFLARVPAASEAWVSRVSELHEHLAQGDFGRAARSAGYLSDAAFTAADRVAQAWLDVRENYRGLLPRSLKKEGDNIWNYKDCAADLYCHLVIEAFLIAPKHLAALRDILAKERAITDGLPHGIRLESGASLGETLDERMFGAVEYAKDGLLPILERIGPSEWLDRLHEVAAAIIESSPVETRYGRLPGGTAEKNGEFLQVLARLYAREARPEYLAAGRAIADAYTAEVLPAGNGVPAGEWTFGAQMPRDASLRLRDHGNEIVSGLVEWVMLEARTPGGRAEQYRPEVERMMDALLARGRDASGGWSDLILPAGRTPLPPPARPVNDNWGYLTAAYVGYALSLPENSPRGERYLAEAKRAFEAAIKYRSSAWETGQMDGYSDTIESAQYLLPYLESEGAARWIDSEMGVLLAYQRPDGFGIETYLDGNLVRTALLYGLFRTQGARVDPWRPGVRLGAVPSPDGLEVALGSDAAWTGRIIFDQSRHREHLNLPAEYPRLNGWTEWFSAKPSMSYELTLTSEGKAAETKIVAGREMIEGLAVSAPAEKASLHIAVRARD
jgi:hypothetical protein